MERELDMNSPEKAEDSRILGVNCNVDDYTAVTNTGLFIGNTNYSTTSAANVKNAAPACNRLEREVLT